MLIGAVVSRRAGWRPPKCPSSLSCIILGLAGGKDGLCNRNEEHLPARKSVHVKEMPKDKYISVSINSLSLDFFSIFLRTPECSVLLD